MLTVYCWLLRLYPESHRDEFGEEMTVVFRDARSTLPARAGCEGQLLRTRILWAFGGRPQCAL